MPRLTLLLACAWLALGVFLLWDASQGQPGRMEFLLGGICVAVAIGNFVYSKRLRAKLGGR